MKIFSQNSFKSLASATATALIFAASAAQASPCTDACVEKANAAGRAAATIAGNKKMNECLQMTPGADQNYCFSHIQLAAMGAYGQAYTESMNECYGRCALLGQL